MGNTENKELKIETLSVDSSSTSQLTIGEQILRISKNESVMKERNNASSFLDELENFERTSEELKLDDIEIGTLEDFEVTE